MIDRAAVLDALVAEGTLDDASVAAIGQHADGQSYDGPWYLQALTIFGAWIASLFLLGFIAVLTGGKSEGLTALGVLILVAVVVTQRMQSTPFVRQIALASATCAQIMLILANVDRHRDLVGAATVATVVAAALCVLHRDPQQRFLPPLVAVVVGLMAACWDKESAWLLDGMLTVEIVIIGAAYTLPRSRAWLAPLGLSMIVAAGATLIVMQYWVSLWPAKAVVTVACLWLATRLADGRPAVPTMIGIVATGLLTAPGILFGMALMGLGLARADRLLSSFGAIFMAIFISYFYYFLTVDLFAKSVILTASGLAVLAARAMISSGHLSVSMPSAPASFGGAQGGFLAVSVALMALLNLAVWQKAELVSHGRVVLLELAPVDPRSLMQGDYMRLSYALERDLNGRGASSGRLVVKLDDRGVGTLARVDDHADSADEQVLRYRGADYRWQVGPNGWYFEEGQAELYRGAKYGELRCDAFGNCVLVGLRDSRLRPIVP